jgi:hypothetical protein
MIEMTKREFDVFSRDCDRKDDWKCKKTGYACRDYMCYKLKEEQRSNLKPAPLKNEPCNKCEGDMAVQVLVKIKKCSRCPKCGRKL